jgi:Domain of unknown function (DUF4386)
MTDHAVETSLRFQAVRTYARLAGVLFLLTIAAGGFAEFYAPSQLVVPADATATANNIVASEWLFRLGFASYLVEAMCDIALALIFYVLLRPVRKDLALLAAFFGLVSTTTFAAAELFYYFGASLILGGAPYLKTFSPAQLNTLVLLLLKLCGTGGEIFMVFYGVAAILRGYLIFQSGYLPKFLGVLLTLGGLGFVTRNFALVLAPAYAYDWLLLPMFIAALSLTLWFLVRGVNVQRWKERASASGMSI